MKKILALICILSMVLAIPGCSNHEIPLAEFEEGEWFIVEETEAPKTTVTPKTTATSRTTEPPKITEAPPVTRAANVTVAPIVTDPPRTTTTEAQRVKAEPFDIHPKYPTAIFDSLYSFREMRRLAEGTSESQFRAYARETEISINGIESRGNAIWLIEKIEHAYIPILERELKHLPFKSMSVQHNHGEISVSYGIVDKRGGINFIVNYGSRNASEAISTQVTEYGDTLHQLQSQWRGIKYYLFEPDEDDLERRISRFLLDVDGYLVRVNAFEYDNADEALKDIQLFSFEQLGRI